MDGPERRHPGDVDAALNRAVAVWAGPMARVVAIALLSVDPASDGAGDRRYQITTRVGLDDPITWLVVAQWLSIDVISGLVPVDLPDAMQPVPGELDPRDQGYGWVVFPDPPVAS